MKNTQSLLLLFFFRRFDGVKYLWKQGVEWASFHFSVYVSVTKQANRAVVLKVETLCSKIEEWPYGKEAEAAFEEMMALLPKVLDARDYSAEKNEELRAMDMRDVPNRVRERLRISIVEQARRIAEEVGQLPAGTVRSLPTVATVNNYCEKIYKLLGSRGAV